MRLELKNITHCYGSVKALNQLNLVLEEGVYALLGPNGAGKSTLMKLLTLNLTPTEGMILCDGVEIQKLGKNYRTLIGYMPQHQGLYENFDAYRFLAYMGCLKGMKKRNWIVKSIEY